MSLVAIGQHVVFVFRILHPQRAVVAKSLSDSLARTLDPKDNTKHE